MRILLNLEKLLTSRVIARASKRFIFVMVAVFSGYLINAQDVSGTITDAENGDPIIGATVLEKGSENNGTTTDFDGNFSLNLQTDNPVLSISYVGYAPQDIDVNGQNNFDIKLNPGLLVDEVVVTALGIKRETKALGYAVTELKGEDIAMLNTVSPIEALQGKSAGLSIGASDGGLFGHTKIQLRGVSVLNSNNNQPIYVIDGVIVEAGVSNASADWSSSANDYGSILKNLNSDNIESVSVLKGAAATALYGSRGINGAIVIKNKDGKGRQGLGVNFSQSVGITDVYDQPDLQYEFGPGTLAGYVGYGEKDANGNYYRFDVNQVQTREVDGQQIMSKIPYSGELGYGPKFDGRPIEDYDGEIRSYSAFPNNMVNAYETGVNSNTALALSGSNDRGSFYLSDSYNTRTGIMPTDKFTRNSLLFKGSFNFSPWLTADASMTYTTSSATNPGNDLSGSFATGDWRAWYDTERWSQRDVYQAPHGGTPQSNYGDQYANVPGNGTWFSYNLNDATREEQVVRPIIRLTADLTDWISVYAEANMNDYSIFYENQQLGSGYANDGGFYELRNDRDRSRTGKLVANLNKNWGDILTSNLIVGGEIWDQENQYTRTWTDGGLIVPGRFYIDNSKRTPRTSAAINGTKQINSVYFLGSLGWKNQLYLDVTGRNDWSSTLVYSDGTGNYSYFYPSVSASWLLSETFNLPSFISFGKLRASWAQVGNDTGPYTINTGYGLGSYELAGGNFVYTNTKSTTLVDPSIKPERKNSMEVGLDFRLFTGRLNADVAYYDESITNQIGSIPIPSSTGFGSMFTNIGTLRNKGFELSVKVIPLQIKNFEWETSFNYWNNTTTISDLRDEVGEYKRLGGDVAYGNFRVGSVAFEDGEYGVLYSDTKPLEDGNGNKIFTWKDDRRGAHYTRSYEAQEIGKVNPDFEGSWGNTFTYKNLRLSVLLDARYGGHIASYSNKYGTSYGYLESSLVARDEEHGGLTWTSEYEDTKGRVYHDGIIPEGVFAADQVVTAPDGEQVNVGGMTYQEAYDAGHVEPTHASLYTYFNSAWSSGVINDNWFNEVKYIALRNVTLGYNLPKTIAQKLKAQNLYLAFTGRNLGYLFNSLPNNLNPESFRGTSSSDSFRERSFMPYSANYTFTLNIGF